MKVRRLVTGAGEGDVESFQEGSEGVRRIHRRESGCEVRWDDHWRFYPWSAILYLETVET